MALKVGELYGELKLNDVGFRSGIAMAHKAMLGLSAAVAGLSIASFRATSDIESLMLGLETLMGSASAAKEEFKKLLEVAKLPGLGLQEAVRGAVRLQAAGLSADDAREALLQFGNAIAKVGGGRVELDRVTLALGQMMSKGRIAAQELNLQLAESIPGLQKTLREIFGVADAELLNERFQSNVAEFIRQLTAAYAKQGRVAGGLRNTWENLTDSITLSLYELGNEMKPGFQKLLDSVAEFINENKRWFIPFFTQTLVPIITNTVLPALKHLGDYVRRAMEAFNRLDPKTKKLIVETTLALGALSLVIKPLSGAISGLIATVQMIAPVFASSLPAIIAVAGAIAILTKALQTLKDIGIARKKAQEVKESEKIYRDYLKHHRGEIRAAEEKLQAEIRARAAAKSTKQVQQQTAAITDDEIAKIQELVAEKRRLAEEERKRRQDIIGWTTLQDLWRNAMVAGSKLAFGPAITMPGINNAVPTPRELKDMLAELRKQTKMQEDLLNEYRRRLGVLI